MIAVARRILATRLMRNILALYGVKIVNQLLPLVTLPYLARVLGPAEWGMVAFAQAFAVYGIVVVQYGFDLSGTREVARQRERPERLAELMGGIVAAQLLLALVAILGALVALALVPLFAERPELLALALLFAFFQGLSPVWYFTGQERIALIAAIDTAAKALGVVLIFITVQRPDDGWLVLACYGGAAGLSSAIGWWLALGEIRPLRPTMAVVRASLRLGFSMFLMRATIMSHTAGNVFLLGLFVAPAQIAFFVAAEKLTRPVAALFEPVNRALLPRLAHLVGQRPDRAQALGALSFWFMTLSGVAMALGVVLVAPWIVPVMFGPGYEASIDIMRVLAPIIPLIILNSALAIQWLIPRQLDRSLNIAIGIGAVTNVVLALIIVPRYQALGMAWITVTVETLIFVLLLSALRRRGVNPWRGASLATDGQVS